MAMIDSTPERRFRRLRAPLTVAGAVLLGVVPGAEAACTGAGSG